MTWFCAGIEQSDFATWFFSPDPLCLRGKSPKLSLGGAGGRGKSAIFCDSPTYRNGHVVLRWPQCFSLYAVATGQDAFSATWRAKKTYVAPARCQRRPRCIFPVEMGRHVCHVAATFLQ